MKKLILALLAAGTVVTAEAQKAGSILLYGNAGFSTQKTTNDDGLPGTTDGINKYNSWNFSPGVGYQINRYLTIGLNFSYAGTKTSVDTGGFEATVKTHELGVGPFVRMTMPINRTFFVFHQLNASYLHGKTEYDFPGFPTTEITSNGFAVNWFPAVGINVTHCMALNFSFGGLGYTQRKFDYAGSTESKVSNFDITFGRQFNFGISANFGGRRHMRGHSEPGMDHRHMDTSDDSDDDDAPKKKRSSSDVDE